MNGNNAGNKDEVSFTHVYATCRDGNGDTHQHAATLFDRDGKFVDTAGSIADDVAQHAEFYGGKEQDVDAIRTARREKRRMKLPSSNGVNLTYDGARDTFYASSPDGQSAVYEYQKRTAKKEDLFLITFVNRGALAKGLRSKSMGMPTIELFDPGMDVMDLREKLMDRAVLAMDDHSRYRNLYKRGEEEVRLFTVGIPETEAGADRNHPGGTMRVAGTSPDGTKYKSQPAVEAILVTESQLEMVSDLYADLRTCSDMERSALNRDKPVRDLPIDMDYLFKQAQFYNGLRRTQLGDRAPDVTDPASPECVETQQVDQLLRIDHEDGAPQKEYYNELDSGYTDEELLNARRKYRLKLAESLLPSSGREEPSDRVHNWDDPDPEEEPDKGDDGPEMW